jgi:2-amino-4-hydroxy-6-hydroxymethyldihydropteridine diphosphokinase
VNSVKRQPVSAFIALGANLGDAVQTIKQAILDLGSLSQTTLLRQSSLYKTAPIESTGPDYVNAVAEVATTLTPRALLVALQGLEQAAGRERPYRNAPRTLDLDILLFGNETLVKADLVIPHPRMVSRAFVLIPLAEIAPGKVSALQLRAVADQPITRIV